MEYLVYFLLGAVAGLASGLFGIGGGIVIVPILLLSFAAQGISPEVATHVAIATSLACIAVTSFSSIYTHYQKGVLDWRIIKLLIPGIVTGSLIGTLFFVSLEGLLLQVLLGGFLIISGLQMLIKRSEGTQVALFKATCFDAFWHWHWRHIVFIWRWWRCVHYASVNSFWGAYP